VIRAILDSNTSLIEAAMADHADVIVTGDQDLLTLGSVDQIRNLTPRDLLDVLRSGC
jgi:predicted nucleic acid-binding protein